MRRALLLTAAGAFVILAGCSSSSKDSSSSGATTIPLTPITTVAGADASATSVDPEAPPASLPSDPAQAIQTFYEAAGGTLSDSEATCVAQSTGPGIVASLQAALEGGDIGDDAGKSLLKGFAVCEPAAYVTQTTASIVQQSGATQEQAACVLTAVDKLFATDDAVLSQAASPTATKDWPAAEHQKFSDAVKSCVPDELAEKIVDA